MALLHAAVSLRMSEGFRFFIGAVHVQHGLRGEASLQDECCVRDACRLLRVPLYVYDADLSGAMETPGIETAARRERQRIFADCSKRFGAEGVLLAHHGDDQAETVLMHLWRGAGSDGLSGMAESSPFSPCFSGAFPRIRPKLPAGIRFVFSGRLKPAKRLRHPCRLLRPFLSIPKAELLSALQLSGIHWQTDESNSSPVTPRNVLRNRLMPMIEALYPEAGKHVANAACLVREDAEALNRWAEQVYNNSLLDAAPFFALRTGTLLTLPKAIQSRVLRLFVRDSWKLRGVCPQEEHLSREQTEALITLLQGDPGNDLPLPCGLIAHRRVQFLHMTDEHEKALNPPRSFRPVTLAAWLSEGIPAEKEIGGYRFRLSAPGSGYKNPKNARALCLSESLLNEELLFRLPSAEDRFRLFGSPGHKPLRRFFTDRKIEPLLRSCIPVLSSGSTVLWICGIAAAEETRLNGDGVLLIEVIPPCEEELFSPTI